METKSAPAWTRYEPTAVAPWNLRRVSHLHRRAGFAATWDELQRDLADGPQASVDRFLQGRAYSTGVPADFDALSMTLSAAAVGSNNPRRLKAWWLYRMLFSPDPLSERLALLWHNHFATSNAKVDSVELMRRQNDLFRNFARAPFGELFSRVLKAPAMLLWLDAQANRKEHPNENLARESMELFSLGVGNYTERDVKEAARALTGWSTSNREFCDVAEAHDDGEKTILGRTGRFRGDDLVRIVLEHPATAVRLARRLSDLLLGDGGAEDAALGELAAGLRARQLDIAWAVETILRSQRFFSDRNIGNRILGPVEFVVGAVRSLELFDPVPSTLVLAEWTARLGQDLFYPPNVFGWPGGRAWVTTRSMIGRSNFASALVGGSLRNPAQPFDAVRLCERHGWKDLPIGETLHSFFVPLLTGRETNDSVRGIVRESGAAVNADDAQRRAVATLLSAPEAQFG